MSFFFNDLRHAARAVGRSPGFAVLVIAIMALGIGANTAVFSVVNGVLLKPLPYPGADRIVTLRTAFLTAGGTQPQVAIANYRDWRDQSSSFEAMSTYRYGESPVSSETTAEFGRTASVDVQFFRVMGVTPILGRTFTPEETSPGTGRVVDHQLRLLAQPVRRGSTGARADHPDGHHRTIGGGCHAARLPVPGRDGHLGSTDDQLHESHADTISWRSGASNHRSRSTTREPS